MPQVCRLVPDSEQWELPTGHAVYYFSQTLSCPAMPYICCFVTVKLKLLTATSSPNFLVTLFTLSMSTLRSHSPEDQPYEQTPSSPGHDFSIASLSSRYHAMTTSISNKLRSRLKSFGIFKFVTRISISFGLAISIAATRPNFV